MHESFRKEGMSLKYSFLCEFLSGTNEHQGRKGGVSLAL